MSPRNGPGPRVETAAPKVRDPLAELRAEWKRVKKGPLADRLAWLKRPQAVILLKARERDQMVENLERAKKRIYGYLVGGRDRPVPGTACNAAAGDSEWYAGIPLNHPAKCRCEKCQGFTRFPRYYRPRNISFECFLEDQEDLEEGVPKPPSSGGALIDQRRVKAANRRGENYSCEFQNPSSTET